MHVSLSLSLSACLSWLLKVLNRRSSWRGSHWQTNLFPRQHGGASTLPLPKHHAILMKPFNSVHCRLRHPNPLTPERWWQVQAFSRCVMPRGKKYWGKKTHTRPQLNMMTRQFSAPPDLVERTIRWFHRIMCVYLVTGFTLSSEWAILLTFLMDGPERMILNHYASNCVLRFKTILLLHKYTHKHKQTDSKTHTQTVTVYQRITLYGM